jgi:hypothetical protein
VLPSASPLVAAGHRERAAGRDVRGTRGAVGPRRPRRGPPRGARREQGGARQAHTDDLRFYALIEALRLGVPPFRVGSLYLDEGRLSTEDIDAAVLEAAAVRVLHGAAKLAELRSRARAPRRSPGPACRWCPLLGNCEEGRAQLRAEEDDRFGEERFGDDRFGDDRFGDDRFGDDRLGGARTPARTVGPLDDLDDLDDPPPDDPPLDDPPLDGEA